MIRYRLVHVIKDVFRSFWYRKTTTALVLCGVALCISTVFSNAQLGLSMFRHGKEQLDPVQMRRVVLTQSSNTGAKAFDAAELLRISGMRGVDVCTALYEIQVTIEKEVGGKAVLAVLESAAPSDPVFAQQRIKSGRALGKVADEIVLDSTLANSLGVVRPGEPVILRLERTTNGILQQHEQAFHVVGIVKGVGRAYVTDDVARSLDFWADHVTRRVGEELAHGPSEYRSVLAYSEFRYREDVKSLASRMGLKVTLVDSVDIPRLGSDCWYCIETPVYEAAPGLSVMPVYVQRDGSECTIALADHDPRRNQITDTANRNKMLSMLGDDLMPTDGVIRLTTLADMAAERVNLTSLPKSGEWIVTDDPRAFDEVRTNVMAPDRLPPVHVAVTFPDVSPQTELNFVSQISPEIEVIPNVAKHDGPDSQKPQPPPAPRRMYDAPLSVVEYRLATERTHPRARIQYHLEGEWNSVRNTLRGLRNSGGEVSDGPRFARSIHLLALARLSQKTSDHISGKDSTLCLPVAMENMKDGRIWVSRTDIGTLQDGTAAEDLPRDVRVATDKALAEAIAQRDPSRYLPAPRWHVCPSDVETWHRLSRITSVTPVDARSMRSVDTYRVVSASGEPIASRVITALRMARPAFLDARGELSIEASCATATLQVHALTSSDLDQFTTGGVCLDGDPITDIVLGNDDFEAAGLSAASAVGSKIPFNISRTDAFGREEQLSLPMSVVGIGQRTCLSLVSVEQLLRWQQGDMEFIDGRFHTPLDIETQRGATRAKLYVTDPSAVEPIAGHFEAGGYLVNHRIDEMLQLKELAKSLGNLTLLLCGGAVLLCGIVVVGHAHMSFALKKTELDSLQSLGVSRLDTVKALLVEGAVFTAMSLGLGLGLVAVLANFYGDVVCDAFRISRHVIQIGLFADGGMEVAGASLALAFGYGLLGQFLPIGAALCSKTAQAGAVPAERLGQNDSPHVTRRQNREQTHR